MLLLSSMNAACLGRVDHPEEIKYMTMKTRVKKCLGDILKFARSHKHLPNGLSRISSCTYRFVLGEIFSGQSVAN